MILMIFYSLVCFLVIFNDFIDFLLFSFVLGENKIILEKNFLKFFHIFSRSAASRGPGGRASSSQTISFQTPKNHKGSADFFVNSFRSHVFLN